jgi:Tfp pilus assembly protein PilO
MTQAVDLIKRNARVVVLIVVAVVLIVVTYMFYSSSQSAADEQATVESQLAVARVNLTQAQDRYDVARLQAEQASLTSSPSFPPSFPNVELSAYIAGAADKYGVTIDVLTPRSPAGTETLGGKKYFRYDTVVEVSGRYDAMNSFMRYLEEGSFKTLRIQSASFTQGEGTFTLAMLTLS